MIRYLTQKLILWAEAPPPTGKAKGELYPGFSVQLKDETPREGQALEGENRYYATLEGDFLWAGGLSEKPLSEASPPKSQSRFTRSSYNAEKAWHLEALGIADIWAMGYTGKGVKVGIIDTGIDPNHPGFNNRDFTGKWKDLWVLDRMVPQPNPVDDDNHGTLVSGILGANYGDYLGVAPACELHVARFLRFRGDPFIDDFINQALQFLIVEQGCKIISFSFGQNQGRKDVKQFIEKHADDVLFIAAIGNANKTARAQFPAKLPEVVAVGMQEDKTLRPDNAATTAPSQVNLWAPGQHVFEGFVSDKDPEIFMGTSLATPIVAGIAALLLEKNKDITAGKLRSLLEACGEKLSDTSYNLKPDSIHETFRLKTLA